MNYTRGIDRNQPEIVAALKAAGATVLDLSQMGGGCPDILIGYQGRNFLVEIKDRSCKRWKGNLKPNQQEFFDAWLGQVAKVTTPEEALALLTNPANEHED